MREEYDIKEQVEWAEFHGRHARRWISASVVANAIDGAYTCAVMAARAARRVTRIEALGHAVRAPSAEELARWRANTASLARAIDLAYPLAELRDARELSLCAAEALDEIRVLVARKAFSEDGARRLISAATHLLNELSRRLSDKRKGNTE